MRDWRLSQWLLHDDDETPRRLYLPGFVLSVGFGMYFAVETIGGGVDKLKETQLEQVDLFCAQK